MIPTILTYSFRGFGKKCPEDLDVGEVTCVPQIGASVFISCDEYGYGKVNPRGCYEVKEVSWDLQFGMDGCPQRNCVTVELEKVE